MEEMETIFVSRHPGAAEWASIHIPGVAEDQVRVVEHFKPSGRPQRVIGTLPVHLAARVCSSGGEYWHLILDLPPELRGQELTYDQMVDHDAQVERFLVRRVEASFNKDGAVYVALSPLPPRGVDSEAETDYNPPFAVDRPGD